jgi:hypothetical protein
VEKLYQDFKDRAEFLLVYIREAHPDSVIFVARDGEETLEQLGAAVFRGDVCEFRAERAADLADAVAVLARDPGRVEEMLRKRDLVLIRRRFRGAVDSRGGPRYTDVNSKRPLLTRRFGKQRRITLRRGIGCDCSYTLHARPTLDHAVRDGRGSK